MVKLETIADTAKLRISTAVIYQTEFELGVDQLVKDLKEVGEDILDNIPNFVDQHRLLPVEVKREILKHTLKKKDKKELKKRIISRKTIKDIYDIFSDDISDFIKALEITEEFYKKHVDECYASDSNFNPDYRFNLNPREPVISHELGKLGKVKNLEEYVEKLEEIGSFAKEVEEFFIECGKRVLGYTDCSYGEKAGIRNTLFFYLDYLGRSFDQFKREFIEVGLDLRNIRLVDQSFDKIKDKEKIKAIVNYVTKKRSRDLINVLTNPNEEITNKIIEMLPEDTSIKNTVKVIYEANKKRNLLYEIRKHNILTKNINKLTGELDYKKILRAIEDSTKEIYSEVIGDIEVPKNLEKRINNIIMAYHKLDQTYKGGIIPQTLKVIAREYIKNGSEHTNNILRNQLANIEFRDRMEKQGINIGAFEKGIQRRYHITTDGKESQRAKERIDSEIAQIFDRIKQLDIKEEEELKGLQKGTIKEQIKKVEKFLKKYKFTEEDQNLKPDIKGHIHTVKSYNGEVNELEADVNFYVSQDPVESLHMGQYFRSCLSLVKHHGGVNAYAAIIQTLDANKNVIYAKSDNGRYLGRNRTVLTDQGILCTRFYQNGNMNLTNAWLDYLIDFAKETGQDIMIPEKFVEGSMEEELKKRKIPKERKDLVLESLHIDSFYSDGLRTQPLSKNKDLDDTRICTNVYIISAA